MKRSSFFILFLLFLGASLVPAAQDGSGFKLPPFEKLVLKNTHMTAFLISAQNSPYFKSQTFGNIIDDVVSHPAQCTFKGAGNHAVVFSGVPSVATAITILQTITSK